MIEDEAPDAQDQAETFDETLVDGDEVTGEPVNADIARDVYDSVYAVGDGVDEDEAADADELSDEALDDMDGAQDEDDLDDAGADTGPLSDDDVVDFTRDIDDPKAFDAHDGARGRDEADVFAMGDANDLATLEESARVSDFEPDDVSDEDLEDLGYSEKE